MLRLIYCICTLFSIMLRLITLNVEGLQSPVKRIQVFQTLALAGFDIIALQETHCDASVLDTWKSEWKGPSCWTTFRSNSAGVAFLFHPKNTTQIISTHKDSQGRILRVTVDINNAVLQLVNIYGPNPQSPNHSARFFENIDSYIEPDKPPILLGDFNMVENAFQDRQGGHPHLARHTYGLPALLALNRSYDLLDVWRQHYPQRRQFTWRSRFDNICSRLDRIYVPRPFLNLVSNTFIQHFVWSDHDVCGMTFYPPATQKRGRGYWKLNIQYLTHPDYQTLIRDFWREWRGLRGTYPNSLQWWDCGKIYIKALSIQYAQEIFLNRRSRKFDLLDELHQARTFHPADFARIHTLEQALQDLEHERNQKLFIHTHIGVREHNEEPNKFFFNLLKSRQRQSSIDSLITTNGDVVTDQPQILEETVNYFESLYSERPDVSLDQQQSFLAHIHTVLAAEQKQALERDITLEELRTALFDTNSEKTAGFDGLPYEFYQTFWDILGNDLLQILHVALNDHHQLPFSHTLSVITLLYKRGDKRHLSNWRPLSLLCCDYKVLTKVLATRLRNVLDTILSPRQTAGVPGRNIQYNLTLIRDYIFFADAAKLNGYILTLDQEKAFDYMNRAFLLQVLQKMQFGAKFIGWVSTLFQDTLAHVLVNGHVSIMFPIKRGVRQGCPLSAPLYAIYVETLSAMIEQDRHIYPLTIPGRRVPKTIQYADDLTLLLSDKTSLTHLFRICTDFEHATGSTINMAKTQGLVLGRPYQGDPIFTTISWQNDTGIEILGLLFFTDYVRTRNANWIVLLDIIRQDLTRFKERKLSLLGKILVLNSVILAKVWYKASVLPLSRPDQRVLETLLFDFLWDGKPDPIQRRTVYLPKDKGGLGLKHPLYQQQSLQLKFIYDVVRPHLHFPWLQLARYYMGRTLALLRPEWVFLRANHLPHYIGVSLPPYYKILLEVFRTLDLTKLPSTAGLTPWKSGHFYTQFLTSHLHHPKAYTDFWSYHRVDPDAMWRHVYTSYAYGPQRDVHFRLLHRVLPTNAFMRQRFRGRGYQHLNTRCISCPNNVENIPHLFFQCLSATPLLTYIYPSVAQLLRFQPFKLFKITLNIFPPNVPLCIRHMVVTLVQITLYVIWLNRNARKFDGILTSIFDSQHRIRYLFQKVLTARFQKCLPNGLAHFRTHFCHTPQICQVVDNSQLVVNLI